MPYLAGVLLFCCSLTASPISSPTDLSGATLIDFDELAGGTCNLCGTPVTTQYSDIGVTFNDPSYANGDTADSNLTQYVPGASGNMLFVEQGGAIGDTPAKPFQILFTVPVTAVGFIFASSANAYLELSAYGPGGTLLETDNFTGTSTKVIGQAGYAGVTEATAITEVDVSYHYEPSYSDPTRTLNFSIDNFSFVDPPLGTPEPSTLILMGVGLLGMGIPALRARR